MIRIVGIGVILYSLFLFFLMLGTLFLSSSGGGIANNAIFSQIYFNLSPLSNVCLLLAGIDLMWKGNPNTITKTLIALGGLAILYIPILLITKFTL